MTRRLARMTAFLFLISPTLLTAQATDDRAGVERAVLDYVEGFYEGDTTKLLRSIHPDVHKYGYFIPRDSTRYAGSAMPYAEFFAFARRVKERNQPAPATAPRKVEIYDVNDQIAAAKLTAYWGIDYLLLSKHNGAWMVREVLWQTPPKGGTP
jgi:hypothetical protein